MTKSLGRRVGKLDLELYRDSPFVDYIERDPLTSGFLLFPLLDPPVQWDAVVTDGVRATWTIAKQMTAVIPNGTKVEVWLDGEAVREGTVHRYGDLG